MSSLKSPASRRLRYLALPARESGEKDSSHTDPIGQIRTDLAMEAHEALMKKEETIEGLSAHSEESGSTTVTRTVVENELASQLIGKAIGTYVTIQTEELTGHDHDAELDISRLLAKELKALLERLAVNSDDLILVIGLGNWNATPDNVGPLTVSKLLVTRHLHEYRVLEDEFLSKMRPVAALSPGVLGLTGMESADIVRAVVERIQPAAVICVDALASTSIDRVGKTIQLSDAGIKPGSGVGNVRHGLTKESIGIPVIAVGVPTVIYATTIISEAMDLLEQSGQSNFPPVDPTLLIKEAPARQSIPRSSKREILQNVLGHSMGNLIVTPKQIDVLVETVSDVIADGLNEALHEGISAEEAALLR